MSEQSVVVELGRQASFWRSASGRVVGGGFSGGLSEGAAGVVVGGLGRVGYRRQDGVRLALLFLERQHSHVELRANSIWLGKGQYLTLFFVSIYISRYNLEADKQPLVFQPAARRSRPQDPHPPLSPHRQ